MVIRRKNSEQTVYSVLNLSNEEQWIEFPVDGCGVLTDVLNENTAFTCSNYVKLPVPPRSSRILVLSKDKDEEEESA